MNNFHDITDLIKACEDPNNTIFVAFGFILCMFSEMLSALLCDLVDYVRKKWKEKKDVRE